MNEQLTLISEEAKDELHRLLLSGKYMTEDQTINPKVIDLLKSMGHSLPEDILRNNDGPKISTAIAEFISDKKAN